MVECIHSTLCGALWIGWLGEEVGVGVFFRGLLGWSHFLLLHHTSSCVPERRFSQVQVRWDPHGETWCNRKKEACNYFAPKERGNRRERIRWAKKIPWASYVKTIFQPYNPFLLCSPFTTVTRVFFWNFLSMVFRGLCHDLRCNERDLRSCLALQAVLSDATSFRGIFSSHL